MRRRDFLAIVPLGVLAGCRQPLSTSSGGFSPAETERIRVAREVRQQHLKLLELHRVPANATRTTPAPPTDLLKLAPELKGLTRVAVRLHPRFGDEPGFAESKIGGRFLWPASEPWPRCPEHAIPLAAVLQLKSDDAPPQFPFQPKTDLLQLLWCPRDHGPNGPKPFVVWRSRTTGNESRLEAPASESAFPEYVPVPCRVFPERITEFPPAGLLPEPVRDKLAKLTLPDRPAEPWVLDLLGPCPGTKVGGYPFGATRIDVTACETCQRPMDFLLAISESEWDGELWRRWMPEEERHNRGKAEAELAYRLATGLKFPKTKRMNVFVCTRCEGWPVRVVG